MEVPKLSTGNLHDKVVLITGGGRGIGRSIALAFAEKGAKAAVAARTESELQNVANEILSHSGQAIAVKADVTQEDEVEAMVANVRSRLGAIDILVNNAGSAIFKPLLDTSLEDWQVMMGANLKSVFLCVKAVLPEMIGRRAGRIINIVSTAGKKGYINQSAYCASKHGAIGFSKVLAMEAQEYNIRVNVICPGGVDTRLVREGRDDVDLSKYMKPDEIANIAVLVATQDAIATIDELVVRREEAAPWS